MMNEVMMMIGSSQMTNIYHEITQNPGALKENGISAQCHAIDFYKRFGFEIISDIYLDAGISHRDMRLEF